MKINVIFSPVNIDELYFTGKTTVVIDVLRATTTIVTALMHGAKEIIPVGSVEFAMKASSSMFGGQTLIAGERNSKMIDGFNLGNSPLEYLNGVIAGKSIVFYTTNGSKAIVKAKFSQCNIIMSFINITAVANHLISLDSDFEILCSGHNNLFSLEDTICAGRLIAAILEKKENCELTDAAKAALSLSKSLGKNIKKMLTTSEHGKFLFENGFQDDVNYCAKMDLTEIIPSFNTNSIKILNVKPSNSEMN